jgi:Tfp pilus assembly protein PilV
MRTERGFSLLEALVATAIVIVGLTGLAQLLVISPAANRAAKSASVAAMLAQDKMERLVAFADTGPAECDYFDSSGRALGIGDGAMAPPGTAYVRSWSNEPAPESLSELSVWQVIVTRIGGAADVRLVGIRPRSAP